MQKLVLGLALLGMASGFQITPGALSPSAFRGMSLSDSAAATAPQRARFTPVMGIKELRDRVTSVKSTKKITSAMRLVAAAKVRRAQDAVLKTRPFSETLQKVLGGLIVRLKKDNFDSPLMAERPVNKVLLVAMTGDRGLCGGFNTYAIKKAEARMRELKDQGIDVDMVTIGNKGTQYFKKRENVVNSYSMGGAPSAEQATEIADSILATYLAGDADRVELMYTSFTSLIASEPRVRTMLPLNPTGIETEGDEIFMMTSKDGEFAVESVKTDPVEPAKFPKDMIFEQDPEQILSAILPLYFNGQVLRQMQESVASELAARMTAMQSASDNASDLITSLSRQMNRERQAAITQELAEIVAGASSG
mmetsp:Transcript_32724/g.51040  ORF Transcript_32724/g.51040 Transcript_32724/m.51040 type:complete len:364 (+) Transcript_32724:1719-2810(+)|eukprot:CAMPEP_0184288124 /NCGR_PEP_ID=MMETSP1049-20130417/639_1 /TAXON_ID=77928 /ORGANISM="Proteomonas sulcata, Strain CCMP704" /LENGTH=363 /DNA_ID=CAMNT_0026594343 /DNA_START=82 /DNA_END=1173 /DNA_ORIENTATION=+